MAVPNNSPSNIDAVLKLRQALPKLKVTEGKWIEHTGQFNYLFQVNETHMVRFPRYDIDAEAFGHRLDALRKIGPSLPLPIPVPLKTEPTIDPPLYVYNKLKGLPLWQHLLFKLNEANLKQVAADLAGFLKDLHQIPTADLNLPEGDTLDSWQQMYSDIRTYLFEHMREDAKEDVQALFEGFLNDPKQHTFTPALRHGDFGASNILYDPTTHKLTGILDFDFLAIGDPAADLASISTYGPLFSNEIFQLYPATPDMYGRIRFYRETFALQEALHGAMNNDPIAFESGIAPYR